MIYSKKIETENLEYKISYAERGIGYFDFNYD